MISLSLTINYLGGAMPQSAPATNTIVGNAPGQTLTGRAGTNNAIISDGGASTLIGGGDDDTFYVVDPSDQVIVAPNTGGIDTVVSWAPQYQLPANVQNLTFYGAGNWGAGNALGNLIIMGGNDANTMDGGAGNDVLVGGLGENDFQFEVSSPAHFPGARGRSSQPRLYWVGLFPWPCLPVPVCEHVPRSYSRPPF